MTGPAGGWAPIGPAGIVHGQTDAIDASLTRWGSAAVSGRVTTIVADPSDPDSKVYVGTALGGVWKQVVDGDGTQHWEPLIDHESVISIGALGLSADGTVLWAGTGDSAFGGDAVVGHGVLRIDLSAGTTVRYYAGGNIVGLPSPPATPVASGLPAGLTCFKLVVDPGNTNHVVVATSVGVFELTAIDQGFSEVQLQPAGGAPVSVPASDILYDGVSADPAKHILWAAHRRPGGPVVSRRIGPPGPTNHLIPAADVGLPSASAHGQRAVLSQCTSNPAVVYLAMATSDTSIGMWRTTNAPHGDAAPTTTAWTPLTPPAPPGGIKQATYNLVMAVHPSQQDVVYLGEARLWRTRTGGAAASSNPWEQCGTVTATSQGIHWDQHALWLHGSPTTATFEGVRIWAGNDGGVWRSVDGGTAFGPRNRGLQTLQFFQLVSHPTARPVIFAGAQDNGVLRSDGSGSWLEVSQGDGCYVSIDADQPTTWYQGYVSYPKTSNDGTARPAGSRFLGIQRSTDAGAIGSFRVVSGPSSTTPGTTDSIDPTDDALFYAPFIVVPSGTAGTAGEVWLGTNRLYRSSDRGDHWQKVGPVVLPPIPNRSPTLFQGISAIACAPGHPERIYAGTSNGRLFRFDRAGGTWGTGPAQAFTELTANLVAADATLTGSFVSDIAVVRNGSDDRVVVALGLNHISGGAVSPGPAASLAVSENSGGSFAKLTVENLTFADGTTVDGQHNPANAVAIDPTNPAIVYIGCDFGVFRHQIGVDPSPVAFNQGLPNAPVLDLDVWPRDGSGSITVLRAATHGRGIFETDISPTAPAAPGAFIFFRDSVADDGRDPLMGETSPDPFGTATVSSSASPDVKIESEYRTGGTPTRTSTTDYTPGGPLDFIGFASLEEGSLVGGRPANVWVQVHNRGPVPATNVAVRAYWAEQSSGSTPDLQSGFWTGFPAADPPAGDWKALGPAVTIPRVRAGEPGLASWSWTLPGEGTGTDGGLLVAVTSVEDPFVAPASLVAAEAARGSRFVAYRDVSTNIPEWELITLIVLGVGLGVAAGVGIGYAIAHGQG